MFVVCALVFMCCAVDVCLCVCLFCSGWCLCIVRSSSYVLFDLCVLCVLMFMCCVCVVVCLCGCLFVCLC